MKRMVLNPVLLIAITVAGNFMKDKILILTILGLFNTIAFGQNKKLVLRQNVNNERIAIKEGRNIILYLETV